MSDAQQDCATKPGRNSDAQRRAAAERMRASRERRRSGLRSISLDVRDTEVDALVRRGMLAPADRDDTSAIAEALGILLDEVFGA